MNNNNTIIRNEMKKKRLRFFAEQGEYAVFSHACQVLVLQSSLWKTSTNVALYRPFRGEVDTMLLIEKAFEDKKNLYFPRCIQTDIQEENTMEFVQIIEEKFSLSFESGMYAIQEPCKDLCAVPLPSDTLIILPCLAYNSEGYRLGYGGGYYDRLLANHQGYSLVMAFSFQYSADIEPQVWDVPINIIANEKEIYECNI